MQGDLNFEASTPVKPPCINTHVVVYKVRGWTFTTQPMSETSAMLCLADFGFANPQIKFAATMRKLP